MSNEGVTQEFRSLLGQVQSAVDKTDMSTNYILPSSPTGISYGCIFKGVTTGVFVDDNTKEQTPWISLTFQVADETKDNNGREFSWRFYLSEKQLFLLSELFAFADMVAGEAIYSQSKSVEDALSLLAGHANSLVVEVTATSRIIKKGNRKGESATKYSVSSIIDRVS